MLPAEMGGGAVLAVAGKQLVFAPETIDATIAQLTTVLEQINSVQQMSTDELAGPPAAQDFASAGAVNNLRESASRLLRRMDEAAAQVQAAIDNLRANGSAYSRSDVAPAAGAVTT